MSKNISNAIVALVPGEGFSVHNDITNEQEYNTNVVFINPASKPSWSAVQAQVPTEQWVDVRGLRDDKLSVCDWTVLPDVPMTPEKKAEWETYRQALRDITTQPDPFNITWPTPPAE